MKNTLFRLFCGSVLCMSFSVSMHAQNTPPWNGNLTVLGFADMTSAMYVKPWTVVAADPTGSCTNAAAVEYNSTDHKLFSCDSGTWAAIAGSGSGGGYATIQSNSLNLTQRSVMNFASPISAVDNAGATRTDISIPQANATTNGFLASSDWTNFNNKQVGGNYLLDPSANGVLFRNNLNTTRVATSADISALLTNIYFNTSGLGVGPTVFVPNVSDTLRIFDNTATTGSTVLALQEGAGQGSNNILNITDNSNNVLGFISFASAFPYMQFYAPAGVSQFGSVSVAATGDSVSRIKYGLDSGAPFFAFGPGTGLDVGFERSAANTLTINQGIGTSSKGDLILRNITINGTCYGSGCVSAGVSAVTASAPLASSGGSTPNISIPGGNLTGNGAKIATSTGSLTSNDCAKWDANGNVVDAGAACGSGGGGATQATQLTDFAPSSVTTTSITFGANCSSANPCFTNIGPTRYPFTNSVTLNITAGTGGDNPIFYVDNSGNRTVAYNNTSGNTYTCTGCEVPPVGVAGTPTAPSGSMPLYACVVTAGAFGSTPCNDNRPWLAATPLQNGLGTTITQSGNLTQVNTVENPRNVTGTSDSLSNTDCFGAVTYNNTGAVSVALPQAGLANQFLKGCAIEVRNYGAGLVTITPSGSTINNGQTSLQIVQGASARIISNPAGGALGVYDVTGLAGGGLPITGGTLTGALTVNSAQPEISILGGSSATSSYIGITNDVSTSFSFGVGGSANTNGLTNKAFIYHGTAANFTLDTSGNAAATGGITAGGSLNSGVNTVAFSTTPNFDLSKGNIQFITLTGNVTSSTVSNIKSGTIYVFHICQDATGSRTFASPAWAKAFTTISSTASKCSEEMMQSPDGTNLYLIAANVTGQ